MKKKILSIIAIIIICILIFALADYLFAKKMHNSRIAYYKKFCATEENDKLKHNMRDYPFYYSWKKIPFERIYNAQYDAKYRQFGIAAYKKRPILLFGCSFAKGFNLDYKQKFAYLLSDMTKRYVYDMAFSGMGPGITLFQTQSPQLYNLINSINPDNPPEYAIYVYIQGHEWRIFSNKYVLEGFEALQLGYNQKNGELIKGENPLIDFFTRFAIGKNFAVEYFRKEANNNKKMNSLMKKYFIQARKELQKRYPDIKFIIMLYPVYIRYKDINTTFFEETKELWNELENEGFIIYDLTKKIDVDIATEEYVLPDTHPNAKAWQVITPKFVKDLGL